jgi:hypothetical protein
MQPSPNTTGNHSVRLALETTPGRVTSRMAARIEPPSVNGPATVRTAGQTSDWKKSKLPGATVPISEPTSPPPTAARNAARQKISTRLTTGSMPRLSTADGESPSARTMRPSRVTRTASTARTPTAATASTR